MFIFLVLYVILSVIFYLGFERVWKRSLEFSRKSIVGTPKVSVLISFRNEEDFVRSILESLLKQTYSNYELVLIDDRSSDGTYELLSEYAKKFPEKIRVVKIVEEKGKRYGKKQAILRGAEIAAGEYFLFTDADCEVPNTWIEEYLKVFTNGDYDFIAGYSPYKEDGSFLSNLISFDTLLTSYLYLGFASWNRAYMAVGRNMGMKRELFFRLDFYEELATGIDDLSVQQAKKVFPLCTEKSFVYSESLKTFSGYFRQQKRHLGSFSKYKFQYKMLLYFLLFSELMYLTSVILYPVYGIGYFFRGYLFVKNVKKVNKTLTMGKVYIMFAVWLGVRLYVSLPFGKGNTKWTRSEEKHRKYFLR